LKVGLYAINSTKGRLFFAMMIFSPWCAMSTSFDNWVLASDKLTIIGFLPYSFDGQTNYIHTAQVGQDETCRSGIQVKNDIRCIFFAE
jgi:hypothetical protein